MKRSTRMNGNAMCIMPRKAIAWLMLSLAVMTILSLVLIEVRRVVAIRNIRPKNITTTSNVIIDVRPVNLTTDMLTYYQDPDREDNDENLGLTSNNDAVEALFEDKPQCTKKTFLLILVASSPENFERREAIRKSWAHAEKWTLQLPGIKSETLFLVGRSSTKFLDILLKNENDIAGDILIGDYLDTYRNLTLKVMHGFTWSLRHCKPMYLLKTDDDCFVNVPLLIQFLWKFNPVKQNLYAGKVRWSAPVVRDPNSRWFVSDAEYSGSRYAPYANGAGYVFSQDTLRKLVKNSNKIKIFPNEDAYVGAVLNAAGVRPTYSDRFVSHSEPWQTCNFLYLFVIHRVKAARQGEYQDIANKAVKECSMDQIVKDWV